MSARPVSAPHANVAFGVVVLAVAAGYLWLARQIPESLLDDAVGPGGVPVLLGAAVLMLAAIHVVRTVIARRAVSALDVPTSVATSGVRRQRFATVVTLLFGAGYGLVLPVAGYAVSIFLLLVSMSAYHGGGLRRDAVVVATVGAAAFWVLFVWLLGIPQPAGLWAVSRWS